VKHEEKKAKPKPYVWVRNSEGEEFLCPVDALKKIADATEEELANCIGVESLRQYVEI